MRPISINYQKVFPLAQYVNEKIGIEMEVEEGDSVDDVLSAAKKCVEEWHKANYPHLYQQEKSWDEIAEEFHNTPTQFVKSNPSPEPIPEKIITPQDKTIGVFVKDIESCQDIKTLESYRFLLKTPELKTAYDKRLTELQNQ